MKYLLLLCSLTITLTNILAQQSVHDHNTVMYAGNSILLAPQVPWQFHEDASWKYKKMDDHFVKFDGRNNIKYLYYPLARVNDIVVGAAINSERYKHDLEVFVIKVDTNSSDADKQVVWLKQFDNEDEGGHTNEYGSAVTPTADGGCVIVAPITPNTVTNEQLFPMLVIRLDSEGDLMWKKRINKTTGIPNHVAVDNNGNILVFVTNDWLPNSFPGIMKLDGNNGSVLWTQDKLAANISMLASFGGLVEIPKVGYMFIVNFQKDLVFNGSKYHSRAGDINMYSPWNVAAIKLDYSGRAITVYPFLSDEPRYVNECYIDKKSNTIVCTGKRGKLGTGGYIMKEVYGYPGNLTWGNGDSRAIQDFKIEFDLSGKVIKTNGQE